MLFNLNSANTTIGYWNINNDRSNLGLSDDSATYNFTFTGDNMLNNVFRMTFGYIFDEEIFGKYGDKNKLIILAGIAVGLYTVNVGVISNPLITINLLWTATYYQTITNNCILVSPEVGLAYQYYILDHLSLRADARMNTLGPEGSMRLNGTMMGSILFHI